ncbi:nuclear receptor-interacting protein 2 isoform X3 [Ochotona princeps]|uniref:nuclear receptor-interacting protein 2 isoform X3 n=1 Tax=Ochotona princeps TaxID=9978 RepID=UPI0027152222|nr:nuclear receptor-interacting protein 2 isoform X3 [Ochotona princeps]
MSPQNKLNCPASREPSPLPLSPLPSSLLRLQKNSLPCCLLRSRCRWQPHSVIQRRLVEGNQSWLQRKSPLAQAPIHGQESRGNTSGTLLPALLVSCKCQDQLLRVAVDTGAPHNQVSSACLSRLGLGRRVLKGPGGDLAPEPPSQVEQLELQLGQETVACTAQVVGESSLLPAWLLPSPDVLLGVGPAPGVLQDALIMPSGLRPGGQRRGRWVPRGEQQ